MRCCGQLFAQSDDPLTLGACLFRTRKERTVAVFDALEYRFDPVIFLVRNWVELVRVTASTIDGQAEEGLAHDANRIFEFILASCQTLRLILLGVPSLVPRTADEQAGCRDSVVGDRFEHVAGDL